MKRVENKSVLFKLLYISASILFLASCTLKESTPERPYPSDENVSRSFFEYTGKDKKVRLRTFLAGWAPEMTSGENSLEVLTQTNLAGHVNIVFEIEEGLLVGRQINPSFVSKTTDCFLRDDADSKACRKRWNPVVTIPTRHFYYERRKDSRGRLTDEYIENESRSHPLARPMLKLDLSRIEIRDWAMQILWPAMQVDSVKDKEWDFKNNYLGFTVNASNPMAGGSVQGSFRFNFLAFEHDENFTAREITPTRSKNTSFLNLVQVIGKYEKGDLDNPITYAAHWKTRDAKGAQVKHKISLWGFPKEHEQIGFDVINQWNDAFEKIGRGRPFEGEIVNRPYAFDLRHPTIAWVSDRRLGSSAPLGIGLALADVRNGEIKWGMVTVWSGVIDDYINSSVPTSGDVTSSNARSIEKPVVQLSLMEPKRILPASRSSIPVSLTSLSFNAARTALASSYSKEAQNIAELQIQLQKSAPSSLKRIETQNSQPDDLVESLVQSSAGRDRDKDEIAKFLFDRRENVSSLLTTKSQILDQMAQGMEQLSHKFQGMGLANGSAEKIYNAEFVQKILGMPTLDESLQSLPTLNQAGLSEKLAQRNSVSSRDLLNLLEFRPIMSATWSPAAFGMDRRVEDVSQSWLDGIAKYNVDKREAFRTIMKSVLLHEFGHIMGLGHNFKENILPQDGSLPHNSKKIGWVNSHGHKYTDFSLAKLKDDSKTFANMTSIMGYPAGETEVAIPYENWSVGPSDLLSLRFLYNQEYPIYPVDAKGEGDFEFEKLRADGAIYENITRNNRKYRPAFFPNCHDVDADLGTDPYCARWDRGYNATTIVDNYLENLKGNLASSLTAYSDSVKGGNFWMAEYYLWSRFLNGLSRTRLFYDYMRQTYDEDIKKILAGGSESGVQNILDFSDSCQAAAKNEPVTNKVLQQLFADKSKAELVDLCVATAHMMQALETFLELDGKDWTQINYLKKYVSYVTGGEGRFRFERAYGSWKELARVPIKISALMTLTSPYAFKYRGGWTWPVEQYSRQDGSYHLSTLYPNEYSSAITAATEMNMSFGNAELNERSTIGKTIQAMGYYLYNTTGSNDVLSMNAPFVENIRNQTQFDYSFALVDVQRKSEQGKELARKFTATIHNMYGVAPENVPEVYMYKNQRVIMSPPARSLLLPVGKIHWYSPSAGYFYAMKLNYNNDDNDRLKKKSVRKTLEDKYYDVLKPCVQGNRRGLRFFFSDTAVSEKEFPGFTFPATIADDSQDETRFWQSVDEWFDIYFKRDARIDQGACEEALRGQGLVVMAASVLNGFYLWNMGDFVEKSYTW